MVGYALVFSWSSIMCTRTTVTIFSELTCIVVTKGNYSRHLDVNAFNSSCLVILMYNRVTIPGYSSPTSHLTQPDDH